MQAEASREVIEHVLDAATLGGKMRRHLHHEQRRRDAVLVLDVRRIAAVAERLFVAEHQLGHLGDPLEAGQCRGIAEAGILGDAAQQRAGHDGFGHRSRHRRTRATHAFDGPPAEQGADLVAGEHSIGPVRGADPRGRPICVGVVGDDDVGVGRRSFSQGQIHGAGLLRIREVHGREAAVRRKLRGHRDRCGEPRPLRGPHEDLAADSVHGRIDGADIARARREELDRAGDVRIKDAPVERDVVVGRRNIGDRAHRGDARGDVGVGGRHDLTAVTEVHLVAVVIGRIVRRRHHDRTARAQEPDGEGRHRRRQGVWQDHGGDAGASHDARGVVREDVGVPPGVVADDDGVTAGVPQVRRESRGRTHDNDAVHPVAPRAEPAPQAGGAELQGAREGVGKFIDGRLLTGLRSLDQCVEFGTGLVIGIDGDPVPRCLQEVGQAHPRPLPGKSSE